MTRKLALQFLQCFEDCHVSVRCETCIACGKLQLADPDILNKLVDIATHDSLWKLKALAIQGKSKFPELSVINLPICLFHSGMQVGFN